MESVSTLKTRLSFAVLLATALPVDGLAQPANEAPAAPQEFVSAKLAGKVTDTAGQPVSGATVLINRTSGARLDGRLGGNDFKSTTDEAGRYELTVRFASGKTLIVREVFAEKPGYVRAAPPLELRLKGGETENLPFVLEKGEIFAGVVRVPLTDVERLSRRKAEEMQRVLEISGPALDRLTLNARSVLTEPGGRFEAWVPRGEYLVRLHGYQAEPVEWTGLKSGQTNLVLDLPAFEWSEANLGQAFDRFWEVMDRQYSYFFLKKDVDWQASKKTFRPKAVQAKNAQELATVLLEMLAPLRDLHVRLETPSGAIPTYRIPWTYNGNFQVTLEQLEARTECGTFAVVGRTKKDGFGCFLMVRQSEANPADVQKAVEAIQKLRGAPGFLVDLRRANGGSEPLAMEIAKLFCAKETVYAKNKYRNGPGHGDFTKDYERLLPASPEPYTNPVVCLMGQGTISSGEGFAKMMAALPNVTTVGQPTRGASGNPKPWPLPLTGVTVSFSRWVDMLPDGRTFEGVGMPPGVEVKESPEAYAKRDPTLEKGMELLREKIGATKPQKE